MELTKEFLLAKTHEDLEECEAHISNIGWSLGNACPCKCKQCYSFDVRKQGKDLTIEIIDKIISQIEKLDVKTVNIGGNEPWFTNGLDGESLFPYIIEQLTLRGIKVGITTTGITLMKLYEHSPETLELINDVDISLDSPFEDEHNESRGVKIYQMAIKALDICSEYNIPKSIIMCAMKWNFTKDRLEALVKLAKEKEANVRFNVLKPTSAEHLEMMMTNEQFYEGYKYLLSECETVDITEPFLSAATNNTESHRCPCGRTSLRIHSITPDGKIPVSPCVYIHDYKVGNLLEDDILDIINSQPFKEFRRRNANPKKIKGCENCERSQICGGGCAAKAYLCNLWETGERDIFVREPGCPKEYNLSENYAYSKHSDDSESLVHMDYLCTWIGKPRS